MRTILIIQSLIIIAGAYYIYTLSHSREEATTTVSEPVIIESTEVESADQADDASNEEVETDDQASENMPLGNDIGMEFPTPDSEADLEVR